MRKRRKFRRDSNLQDGLRSAEPARSKPFKDNSAVIGFDVQGPITFVARDSSTRSTLPSKVQYLLLCIQG